MDVGETAVRDENGDGLEMDVAVNFGAWAREALTGPGSDILGERLPDKMGGNEAAGGTAARMRDVVEQGEDRAAQSSEFKEAESASGDIAMKQQVLHQNWQFED